MIVRSSQNVLRITARATKFKKLGKLIREVLSQTCNLKFQILQKINLKRGKKKCFSTSEEITFFINKLLHKKEVKTISQKMEKNDNLSL
jgi:hypothetical protein